MRLHRRAHWTTFALALLVSCKNPQCRRKDIKDATTVESGAFGPGQGPSGFTAQCSGWFPDWLWTEANVPSSGQRSFQLSQGYPLGVPVLEETPDGKFRVARYDPYPPADNTAAPWQAFDPRIPAEQAPYLDALKAYFLAGNVGAASAEDDFDVQNNKVRSWFHVPMMHTKSSARREPHHGLTKERALRSNQHSWIKDSDGDGLNAYAIGAYNWLGGYTIGKVFHDPNVQLADPAAAKFIKGAFVFKLLFAEYTPASIEAGNPLDGSPQWMIQDVNAPGTQIPVRLLQVDVAVRDPDHAPKTGWVFATFVYDKTMPGATGWEKLKAVGLQWGDDQGDTAVAAIDESWLNPAVPAVYTRQDGLPFGRNGRLNGPVDNPVSSCISCHSTAQIITGITGTSAAIVDQARGTPLIPPGAGVPPASLDGSCGAGAIFWFHDVAAGAPFGQMGPSGTACAPTTPTPSTPPLYGLDYSLQLADALESALTRQNKNPCTELAATLDEIDVVEAPSGDVGEMAAMRERLQARQLRDFGAEQLKSLPRAVVRPIGKPTKRVLDVKEMPVESGPDLHRR
jgi:hypothetical protein